MKILLKIKIRWLVIFGIIITSLSFPYVRAATVDELKQQKTSLQEKLTEINKQIKNYQGQIEVTRKQQASLKNEVIIYDSEIRTTELQIQAKETQISEANLQIEELQNQIDRRIKEIEQNKEILSELIIQLHELDSNALFILTLGEGNFSEFLDELQYTTNVQDKMYEILQNIKSVKIKLEAQQSDLRIELKKLEEHKNQLEETRVALAQQQRQKQNLLNTTRGLETKYQKLLTASKEEENKLQEEIEGLDASIRTKLGNRTIAPSGGSLAKPMNGIITQKYGNTGFRALGYNFHNGIDIAAPAGTPIYASANGAVNGVGSGEAAYGNWVTTKHTISTKNGERCVVVLNAHMRTTKVKNGQTIKQGDLIGYEGNTGNTTRLLYGPERGYHDHMTVFDCEGFGIAAGKHTKIYGSYSVPFGYTYNPMDFF